MLGKRTSWTVFGSLGGVAIIAGLIIGAYDMQGKPMNPTAFNFLIGTLWAVGILLAFILFLLASEKVLAFMRQCRLQRPIYFIGKHPLQPFLDLADRQQAEPGGFIVFIRQDILDRRFEADQERPYMYFTVYGHNASIYTLQIGIAIGYVYYKGAPLRNKVQESATPRWTTVKPNEQFMVQIQQYFERSESDAAEPLLKDQKRSTGLFNLHVHCPVRIEGRDFEGKWYLTAGGDEFPIVTLR